MVYGVFSYVSCIFTFLHKFTYFKRFGLLDDDDDELWKHRETNITAVFILDNDD